MTRRRRRRRAERCDNRLGQVRKISGNAIAGRDALALKRRRETQDRRLQLRLRDGSDRALFALEDQRRPAPSSVSRFAGEIDRGVGKEPRAGHAVEIADDALDPAGRGRRRTPTSAARSPQGERSRSRRARRSLRWKRSGALTSRHECRQPRRQRCVRRTVPTAVDPCAIMTETLAGSDAGQIRAVLAAGGACAT